jgi:hypothetical protein
MLRVSVESSLSGAVGGRAAPVGHGLTESRTVTNRGGRASGQSMMIVLDVATGALALYRSPANVPTKR